jgi:cysteine synthase A
LETTQSDPTGDLEPLIGNTPLLAIRFRYRGTTRVLFAKSENLNMTGSVKDRMALEILRRAYRTGALRPGGLIVEATSGNTGISFAAIGRALGHPVAIFIPSWMSTERLALLRSFGAELHLVTPEQDGFLGAIQQADRLARETEGAFLPHQFSNEDNCDAHEKGTGPELFHQLSFLGLVPDAFVAGVGTGGTVMGVGRYLRRILPGVKLHPVEPASSPTLSTGFRVGHHRIQGISDEFIPAIVELGFLDAVLAVDDGDAILMAQRLARQVGLAVGISSGANFLAALKAQELLGPSAVVSTVFADSNKKYLSTDLMAEEPEREGYLSPEVDLLGIRAVGRVCALCANPVWSGTEPV